MLRALSLTLGQLGDGAILRILVKSLLLTLLICVAGGFAAATMLDRVLAGYADYMSDTYFAVFEAIAVIAIVFFGFRIVAVPVIGFFADEVVRAIEARHYPQAALAAKPVTFGFSLKLGLASILRLVALNLVALPLYVILVFTAIGPIVAFIAVNALLLGRDLGEMVASRHLDRVALKDWLRTTRGLRGVTGLIVTGLFMVPFANLLAPVIGAGMMTHLFHGRLSIDVA